MDPMRVLKLDLGASLEQAKAKHRELSKQYHPDKNTDKGAQSKFREVQTAYKQVEDNPGLLSRPTHNIYSSRPGESFQVDLEITLSDLFFGRTKTIKYKRLVHCKKCLGTGSKDKEIETCDICEGAGIIKGPIFRIVKSDSKCPQCKGTGVFLLEEDHCAYCKGTTLVTETCEQKIKLNMGYSGKEVLIVKEGGNYGPFRGQNGGLYVKLQMKQVIGQVHLVNKVLCLESPITPAQYMLGGKTSIKVFDKSYVCRIKPRELYTFIAAAGNEVRVDFVVTYPELSADSRKLYEELLKLESISEDSGSSG